MGNVMEMRRCESCGGELFYNETAGFWQCRFCGNKFYPKDDKGEALILALNRGAEFRRRIDFDGAIVEYTAILKAYPDDDEANWGMFIARCGIEYVKDDRTGNMIPTCHRTLKGNVLDDEFYLKATENASEQQAEIYTRQARAIDRLQKRIKQQMEEEEEYEVFISFKSKDENGYPTRDSVVARNIHDKLTSMGIKTFFSEVTLADRIGDEFEPIIYKALHSCRYFILVTTCEAHTNAVWVKNEWARFRDRMDDEHLSKCAFAVFEGKGCVPLFLRGMQGFDLSKYPSGGYEIAIADFLALKLGKIKKNGEAERLKAELEEQRKFYEEQQRKQAEEEEKRRAREEELLRRMEKLDGRGSESALTDNPITPLLKRAYLYLEDSDWKSADDTFERVLDLDPECADAYIGKLMTELNCCKRTDLKNQAVPFDGNKMYIKAIRFASEELKNELQGYIIYINDRNDEAVKETIYNEATCKMLLKTESGYRIAAENFKKIPGYKDADKRCEECLEKAETIHDEAASKKPRRLIAALICIFVILVIPFVCALNSHIIPNFKYNHAISLMNSGKYYSAISAFEELDGFRDSNDKIIECWAREIEVPVHQIVVATTGDMSYFQILNGNIRVTGLCNETILTIPHVFNGEIVTSIDERGFSNCRNLMYITIPESVTRIDNYAFHQCAILENINFEGTREQWMAISKGYGWDSDTGDYTVHCTDGDIGK